MLKYLFKKIVYLFESKSGWNITLTPKKMTLRTTADKSDMGFWYSGNVINSNDIAYGILRNGKVEVEETNLVLKILNQLSISQTVFYEIGANSGYYGILAAYFGKGSVSTFSFEPLDEFPDKRNFFQVFYHNNQYLLGKIINSVPKNIKDLIKKV